MSKDNIHTASSQTAVRRSAWTQKEIDMLIGYELSDDSETLDERLEHAVYMLHYENGFDFPLRTLSAAKKQYYKELKKRKSSKEHFA